MRSAENLVDQLAEANEVGMGTTAYGIYVEAVEYVLNEIHADVAAIGWKRVTPEFDPEGKYGPDRAPDVVSITPTRSIGSTERTVWVNGTAVALLSQSTIDAITLHERRRLGIKE